MLNNVDIQWATGRALVYSLAPLMVCRYAEIAVYIYIKHKKSTVTFISGCLLVIDIRYDDILSKGKSH